MKIAFILPDLGIGGAERQAIELATHLDKQLFDVYVVVINPVGLMAKELENTRVISIRAGSRLMTFAKLVAVLRRLKVDVAQSFLLKTNVYVLAAKLFAPRLKVIVGIRDAMPSRTLGYSNARARAKVRVLCRVLSILRKLASVHVSNSRAGLATKRGLGALVIPNGIDTQRFKPDHGARNRLRELIGVPEETPLIGTVANFSIYKDYPTFIQAARLVLREAPGVHVVCIGDDQTPEGASAAGLARSIGLAPSLHFLGTREDVDKLLPGMDLFCSASLTEGFSNAICEAMACGIPCVVTDVGDSALIVGEAGLVVRPGSPEELATAILQVLRLTAAECETMKGAGRRRIVGEFGMRRMVSQYEDLYRQMMGNGEKPVDSHVVRKSAI